jgi:hypothetical protein
MREINARSSRKAKAAIEASIHNRTDVRVYPGRFLAEALAGFPTFSATVLSR